MSISENARPAESATDTPGFDIEWARQQFPAFAAPALANWIHMENAGGSYAARQVRDLLVQFYTDSKVQPYYAGDPSRRAGEAMDRAKALVPATLNADRDEVMFGPSTTQNTYILSHAIREQLTEGDEVIVTNQDHEANIGAWRRLAQTGLVVKEWSVDPTTGLLDLEDLKALVNNRTRLVTVNHASNVAATINPIREIAELVHAVGGRLVVDGVSYAPHAAIDVRALDCDFYLYSAYKTFGPHVGIMYAKAAELAKIPNQGHFFNGHMPTYRLTPAGPNHAEIAAAAGMVDYYRAVYEHHVGPATGVADVEVVRAAFALFGQQEQILMLPLADLLTKREGVRLIGSHSADHTVRMPTFAFHTSRQPVQDVYDKLIAAGINCGCGPYDAVRLMKALSINPDQGVIRLSLSHYNTAEEIDRVLNVLDAAL
ncbi:aminotransferase class V-fold PLP-dependent enzyme [Streptomyces sp. NPDC058469]|uniref:aminotransferase class V-fold PLP-dependent enzyme n=1 Tax=Streptomyces sp. NPDC058469 TaxID=3346514 RepID=UPI003655C5F4